MKETVVKIVLVILASLLVVACKAEPSVSQAQKSTATTNQFPTLSSVNSKNDDDVKALRFLLSCNGYSVAQGSTEKAVKEFQSGNGLTPTGAGVVDSKTWEALTGGRLSEIRKGSAGDCVRAAQIELNKHGSALAVDGIFGRLTDQEVRKFQKKGGLTIDGIVGPQTWRALIGRP